MFIKFIVKFLVKVKVMHIILFLSAIFPPLSPVHAETNPDLKFFEDKVVNIVVSTTPGGGFDTIGRMTARYLPKYLPKSIVIVKNVPGAGHIIGANEVYLSKPNGLTFGVGNYKGLIFAQLAGLPGRRFDLTKYSWLANVSSYPSIIILGKNTPFRSVKDLKDSPTPIKMGTGGVGSSGYAYTLMIGKALGINFKMIPGYMGHEADMAMLRGEIDGQFGSLDDLRSMVVNEGARVLLVISRKKLSLVPDAPLLSSFMTPSTKGLINLMLAANELGRPMPAPPNMLPGRLKVLRDAIEKTYTDPKLLEYADHMKLSLTFTSGEDTRKLVGDALDQSPEIVKMVKEFTQSDR